MKAPSNISEMVDALLAKIPEDELRVLCQHHVDGWIDFATPAILEELDRRRMWRAYYAARLRVARLPWWRRIFQ